jgi:hypothetical protein
MTDHELLEYAAKAAGFVNYSVSDTGVCVELGSRSGAVTSYWNPLVDDGDALRLAVTLGLMVDISLHMKESEAGGNGAIYQCELHNLDSYAATRRAIVRAAAEIGKSMEVTK